MQPRTVYLGAGAEQVFGRFHRGAPGGAAVAFCAPWGWEETASYRIRRDWAEALAAAGHHVLRFDYPSVGDSSGAVGDRGRVAAWIAAIDSAAAWLAGETEADRVVAIGLGLGGTLAAAALADGAPIDELVLWAAPDAGSRFLRNVDALRRMHAGRGAGEDAAPLEGGWIEAGGFVLTAATIAELGELAIPAETPPRLRRALLLGRDGTPVKPDVAERIGSGGAEVTLDPGEGWSRMVFHPETAYFPAETTAVIERWLASGGAAGERAPAREVTARTEMSFDSALGAGRETSFDPAPDSGEGFAILCDPVGRNVAPDLCVVFLNAGAVRHIGPNRNWVEDARWLATRGVRSIRVDLKGIGEADGRRPSEEGVAGFYAPEYAAAVRTVLDTAAERGLGRRFFCVGLCSGAYWSLHMADRDERVVGAVLLNLGAVIWHRDLRADRDMQSALGAVLRARSWKRLLRLEMNPVARGRLLWSAVRRWLRGVPRRLRGGGDGGRATELEALFDRIRDTGKPIAMSFSAREPLLLELERDGVIAALERWPNIDYGVLAGEDHALGRVAAQRSGAALVEREVARAVEREGGRIVG